MRSVSGDAFGSVSEAVNVSVRIDNGLNSLPLILGLSLPFGIILAVALVLATVLAIYFAYHQIKLRWSLMVSAYKDCEYIINLSIGHF